MILKQASQLNTGSSGLGNYTFPHCGLPISMSPPHWAPHASESPVLLPEASTYTTVEWLQLKWFIANPEQLIWTLLTLTLATLADTVVWMQREMIQTDSTGCASSPACQVQPGHTATPTLPEASAPEVAAECQSPKPAPCPPELPQKGLLQSPVERIYL